MKIDLRDVLKPYPMTLDEVRDLVERTRRADAESIARTRCKSKSRGPDGRWRKVP